MTQLIWTPGHLYQFGLTPDNPLFDPEPPMDTQSINRMTPSQLRKSLHQAVTALEIARAREQGANDLLDHTRGMMFFWREQARRNKADANSWRFVSRINLIALGLAWVAFLGSVWMIAAQHVHR